jgi:hypothetical protein
VIDLAGAIDLHVHSAPDVYPRSLDDVEVARAAQAAGMRAILLKSHHTLTADRAALVDRQVDITVRGGLALNLPVGGLNPVAVETAIAFGARQIWMPTIHSRQSLRTATAEMFVDEARKGHAGLVAFDEDGDPVATLGPVLELIRDAGIVLGTGHLAPGESMALLRMAREMGLARLLVTHPMMSFTRFSLDQMRRAIELGAYLEFDALACRPEWAGSVPAAATASAITELGADRCVLASDGGQAANPSAPEMLLAFAEALVEAGVPRASLRPMMCDNPAFLLAA